MPKDKEEKMEQKPDYTKLAEQCAREYTLAWKNQKPKKDEWEIRLKLYNNQKRDKTAVGDTTLFTVMQTVLASLYVDRLNAEFSGREEGDEETAKNLTTMAEFDYDEMGKAMVDYDWNWDTCFFGRGILSMEEYERDPENNVFVPMPYVIDPLIFLHDPLATSVNGDRTGRGAMRFGGYETKMTKQEMLDNPHFFDGLQVDLIGSNSVESIIDSAIEARDEAQGRQESLRFENDKQIGSNTTYDVTVWYTHWSDEDGKPAKYKVWLINDREKVVGLQKIDRKKGKRVIWTLVDRPLYPTAHDWDGTSIPDLVEDKQRARAVAQNLGLKAMKADIYPMYVYDSNRIRNRNDLNFEFNKFVPADIPEGGNVTGAIMPITKASPNMGLLDFIYNSLDISAQKATATPEIQQGVMSEEQRTLGEINLIASKVDTRYSLAAKVFGWSEKEFWYHWYALYDENFAEDIDEKILRVVGAFGAKWRPVKRGDIIANIAPDISIESRVLSRAKQLEERQMLSQYLSIVFGDETANVRYGLKKLGSASGLSKDELDRLLPPTIDERIAEAQNDLLNQDKPVPVLPEDDHNIHLEIHTKAKDTDAAYAHIETHKRALSIKKTNPELFPLDQTASNFQAGQERVQPVASPAPTTGQTNPIRPSQTSNIPTTYQQASQP
jgi:hypothetical protein